MVKIFILYEISIYEVEKKYHCMISDIIREVVSKF